MAGRNIASIMTILPDGTLASVESKQALPPEWSLLIT